MRFLLFALALAAFAVPARADVVSAAPDGFLLRQEVTISAAPTSVWRSIGRIGRWWESDHTWSGNAANMRMEGRVGGCFCERWGGNEVEHGRVIAWRPNEMLRLVAPLGPMQEMAVNAVMTFELTEANGQTQLVVTSRVNGASGSQLDQIAPIADRVLATQVGRLKRLVETGSSS